MKYDLRFLASFVPLLIGGAWLYVARTRWRLNGDWLSAVIEGSIATVLILVCAGIWLIIQARRRAERRRRKPPLNLSQG